MNLLLFQYDVPTYVGMLEEEVKDELMETDVPSEGKGCPCVVMVTHIEIIIFLLSLFKMCKTIFFKMCMYVFLW